MKSITKKFFATVMVAVFVLIFSLCLCIEKKSFTAFAEGAASGNNEPVQEETIVWSEGTYESVYGESIASFSATYTKDRGAVSATVTWSPQEHVNAGSYILIATTENGAYSTHLYTIKPRPVEVEWNGTFESVVGEGISGDITAQYPNAAGMLVDAIITGMPEEDANANNYILTATTTDKNYILTNATKVYTVIDNSAEKHVEELEKQIASLNKQIQSLNEQIAQLENNNTVSNEKINELEQKAKNLGNQVSFLQSTISGLQADKETLNSEIYALQVEASELQNTIQDLQAKNGKLGSSNQDRLISVIVLVVFLVVALVAGGYLLWRGKRRSGDLQSEIKRVTEEKKELKERSSYFPRLHPISQPQPHPDPQPIPQPSIPGCYNEVGKRLKKSMECVIEYQKDLEYDYNSRGIEYTYEDIQDLLACISKQQNEIIDALPDYIPKIGDKYSAEIMEKSIEDGYGTVEEVITPGKQCGTYKIRKAKVKTGRKVN